MGTLEQEIDGSAGVCTEISFSRATFRIAPKPPTVLRFSQDHWCGARRARFRSTNLFNSREQFPIVDKNNARLQRFAPSLIGEVRQSDEYATATRKFLAHEST